MDLAGSERVAQTGASGERLKEGQAINKSLFMLTQVITKLSEGLSFVNFRDSKLTRILQNALGGNSLTAIVCTINPSVMYMDQSQSTVQFAVRARNISLKPVLNENLSDNALMKRMEQEIESLKAKLREAESGKEPGNREDMQVELQEKLKIFMEAICSSRPDGQKMPKSTRRFSWAPRDRSYALTVTDDEFSSLRQPQTGSAVKRDMRSALGMDSEQSKRTRKRQVIFRMPAIEPAIEEEDDEFNTSSEGEMKTPVKTIAVPTVDVSLSPICLTAETREIATDTNDDEPLLRLGRQSVVNAVELDSTANFHAFEDVVLLENEVKRLSEENADLKQPCVNCRNLEDEFATVSSQLSSMKRKYEETLAILNEERSSKPESVGSEEVERLNEELASKIVDFEAKCEEVENLKREIESLKAENVTIESLKQEIETLKVENAGIDGLRQEIESLKVNNAEIESLKQELESLKVENSEIAGLKSHLDSLKVENAEIESLKSKIDGFEMLEAQLEGAKSVISNLEGENEQLKEKTVDFENKLSEIDQLKQQVEKVETNEAELEAKKNEIDRLSQELDVLKQRTVELEELKAKIEDADKKNSEQIEQISRLNEEIEQTREKVKENVAKDDEISNLKKMLEEFAAVKQELEQRQSEIVGLSQKLADFETMDEQRKELEGKLNSMQVELEEKSAELENLNSKLNEFNDKESEIERLKAQIEDISSKKEEQNVQLVSLESNTTELDELKQTLETKNVEIDELKSQQEEFEAKKLECTQLGEEIQQLKEKLGSFEGKSEESSSLLEEKLHALETEVEELRAKSEKYTEILQENEDLKQKLVASGSTENNAEEIEVLQKEIDGMFEENRKLAGRIGEKDRNIEEMKRNLDNIENDRKHVLTELEEVQLKHAETLRELEKIREYFTASSTTEMACNTSASLLPIDSCSTPITGTNEVPRRGLLSAMMPRFNQELLINSSQHSAVTSVCVGTDHTVVPSPAFTSPFSVSTLSVQEVTPVKQNFMYVSIFLRIQKVQTIYLQN